MLTSSGRFSIWFYGVTIDRELAHRAEGQDKADRDARKASAERIKSLMSGEVKKKSSSNNVADGANSSSKKKVAIDDDDDSNV